MQFKTCPKVENFFNIDTSCEIKKHKRIAGYMITSNKRKSRPTEQIWKREPRARRNRGHNNLRLFVARESRNYKLRWILLFPRGELSRKNDSACPNTRAKREQWTTERRVARPTACARKKGDDNHHHRRRHRHHHYHHHHHSGSISRSNRPAKRREGGWEGGGGEKRHDNRRRWKTIGFPRQQSISTGTAGNTKINRVDENKKRVKHDTEQFSTKSGSAFD